MSTYRERAETLAATLADDVVVHSRDDKVHRIELTLTDVYADGQRDTIRRVKEALTDCPFHIDYTRAMLCVEQVEKNL